MELSDARRVDESDETDPAKMSGDPPVAITKNAIVTTPYGLYGASMQN